MTNHDPRTPTGSLAAQGRMAGSRPASHACYSYLCSCEPEQRRKQVDLPRAYAYLCEDLLVCRSEVNRAKERLARFAASSNLELAAVFIGRDTRSTAGFGRLFEAVIRDEVKVVLVPSVLHLMVLGSPRRIKEYFEAATDARVITMP
ncbi:hypothetical protein [Kribbella sp. VKM Ac-2566]|uniref:hypothetical protein n=1 Tax=Kribbella sp. VKM Ac-2566 TaxID=2512218 RepID=UPI0010644E5A|nr:hypothetical protein [Kribbella sp. VKM Ac-2566]